MSTRIARVLIAVGAVAALLVIPTSGSTATANQLRLTETFESPFWYRQWGLEVEPWHTRLIEDPTTDGKALRVSFAARSFNGSSWSFPTGTADSVTLSYEVRFGLTWRPMIDSGGKLPGFGLPERNPNGTCAQGCGLQPIRTGHYSARGSFDQLNVGGSYLYTPDCGAAAPRLVAYNRPWHTASFLNGRWYRIRQRIFMNTPGVADGRIQAWVDDELVYDSGPAFCFRNADHPEVHVGNVWMEMYYGGKVPPPIPMWLDLDNVRIAH